MTLQVVLWCWQARKSSPPKGVIRYEPELANRQASAVRAHLSLPHEIVAVTDYPAHLFAPDIRVVPLWDDLRDLGGCYCRLKAFAPEMREVIGPRFVWMDLDMAVVGRLDPLFDHILPVRCWRSDSLRGQPVNGSMVQMTAGAAARVWREFDVGRTPGLARMAGYRGTDQAIMAYLLPSDVAVWTRDDGVCYLSKDCGPKHPPEHARVVFSPGRQKVTDPEVQKRFPWLLEHLESPPPHSPGGPARRGRNQPYVHPRWRSRSPHPSS